MLRTTGVEVMFVAKLMQILPAAAQLVAHLTAMEDAPIPTATEYLTFSATYVLPDSAI